MSLLGEDYLLEERLNADWVSRKWNVHAQIGDIVTLDFVATRRE